MLVGTVPVSQEVIVLVRIETVFWLGLSHPGTQAPYEQALKLRAPAKSYYCLSHALLSQNFCSDNKSRCDFRANQFKSGCEL